MEIIARQAGDEVARGTTDAAGNYDISATAPTAIGEVNCQAAFPGVIPFAASTAQANLGVGMEVTDPIWLIAGTATAALAVLAICLSKG